MSPAMRPRGFRGEFLWELEIATQQITALAGTAPEEIYGWRPHPASRSVSEVLIHVAAGNFMLLDLIGVPAPVDLYFSEPGSGAERFAAMIARNDQMEKTVREKQAVVATLKRSLAAVQQSFAGASEAELDRSLHFFSEQTSIRRVYLRLLSHTHEHMGQMIAYLRSNDIPPPWPDWRPDRRAAG
jgi:uncharacterized damage-inducible protein DinB